MCKTCGADFDSNRHKIYMRLGAFAAIGSGAALELLDALEAWSQEVALELARDAKDTTPTPGAE